MQRAGRAAVRLRVRPGGRPENPETHFPAYRADSHERWQAHFEQQKTKQAEAASTCSARGGRQETTLQLPLRNRGEAQRRRRSRHELAGTSGVEDDSQEAKGQGKGRELTSEDAVNQLTLR